MGIAVLDDCWRRIGVRGDRTCPELVHHIHCRNCPTYGAAGRRLLDAPMPGQYREEWAGHVARPAARRERHTDSAVVFRVGVEWFGIPTGLCSRVLPRRAIHSLPHRRGGAVLGLANVEGTLVLCISLAAILGLAPGRVPGTDAADGRLLVANSPDGQLGMPIEEAHGVCRFREEDLQAVPETVAKSRTPYTRAVLPLADRAVGLLDADNLFRSIRSHLA